MFRKLKIATYSCLAIVLVAGVACSKKRKEDGDSAGDSAVIPSDASSEMRAGKPIPELPTVYFAYDSFKLGADTKKKLEAHVAFIKSHSSLKVQVEGHCDERGTTEYNLALGEKRATAVKDYLVSKGVPSAQLSTISYGEERPAVQGSNESAWAKNRRAEFVSQ